MDKLLRQRVRRDLDEELRVFRSRKVRRSKWGWVRGVRQALGMPVAEVARRMKVGQSEVFRLEMAEVEESITLWKLRAAAAAMGCELVYAVVPLEGTLEDLADRLQQERVKHKEKKAKGKRKSGVACLKDAARAVLEKNGWFKLG